MYHTDLLKSSKSFDKQLLIIIAQDEFNIAEAYTIRIYGAWNIIAYVIVLIY